MKKEIKKILDGVKDGEKVIAYIEELEDDIAELEEEIEELENNTEELEENIKELEETPCENKLTAKDLEKLLKNKAIFTRDSLIILKRIYHLDKPVSMVDLSKNFGWSALRYGAELGRLERRLLPHTGANGLSVLFDITQRMNKEDKKNRVYTYYSLTPELYEALGNVDLSDIPLRENEL